MIAATPTPDKPPAPIVRIGVACRAASITATIKVDRTTYVFTVIELCGNRVVLRGRAK